MINHIIFHENLVFRSGTCSNYYIALLQVSPAELESVIFNHPKVEDVGVVGIPDAQCGELPKAFIVRKDESVTSDEIHTIVRGK